MSGASDRSPPGAGVAAPAQTSPGIGPFVVFVLVGAAVALSLGVFGRVHQPAGTAVTTLGFSSLLAMKAWLTTAALALAAVQVTTALRMYGRIGHGGVPRWVAPTHRVSGVAAVLLTLPVAYQCLWSLGFATYSPRVLAHSFLGCVFYGAFVTKMLTLHSRRVPTWALPWCGGILAATLLALWFTSSLWFFTQGSAGY